jgi:hypothetical protein
MMKLGILSKEQIARYDRHRGYVPGSGHPHDTKH